MPSNAVVPADRDLEALLSDATQQELSLLARVLTDDGNGRLSLSKRVKQSLLDHQRAGTLPQVANLIAAEIRSFGGHTIVNLARRGGPPYRTVVEDVANELALKDHKGKPVHELERAILEELGKRAQEHSLAAPGQAAVLAGVPLAVGARAALLALGGRMAAYANPVGLAISSAWAIHEVARPASRVTVPLVAIVGTIRARQMGEQFEAYKARLAECL